MMAGLKQAKKRLATAVLAVFLTAVSLPLILPQAAVAASPQEACETAGNTWNEADNKCVSSSVGSVASPQQRTCEGSGGTWDKSGKKCKDNAANGPSLSKTITNAINLLLFVIGITAVLVIIIQGLRFVNSNGDTQAVAKAKNGIIFALIGLVVAAMAYALINFILDQL